MRLHDGAAYVELRRDGPNLVALLQTAWFRAELSEPFEADEWTRLAAQLDTLVASDGGSVTFLVRRNWLRLTVVRSKKDELHVTATLQSSPDFLHEATVVLSLHQSDLPTLTQEIHNLVS